MARPTKFIHKAKNKSTSPTLPIMPILLNQPLNIFVMKKFNFVNALITTNCDPYIAESEEVVKECEDFVNSHGVDVMEISTEDEEFRGICSRLDIDLNDPKIKVFRVWVATKHNEQPMYFCTDDDWTFKH